MLPSSLDVGFKQPADPPSRERSEPLTQFLVRCGVDLEVRYPPFKLAKIKPKPIDLAILPMQRILEAEVMDTAQEAEEYDSMDFEVVNADFARCAIALSSTAAKVLDAGTGTARIPILISQARADWQITGIDLARSMLDLGRKNVAAAGLEEQITLELADSKTMPYADNSFDLVVSNSLVHHLPDPLPFFKEIKRVLKPGGAVLLRDLLRPQDVETIAQMVDEICHDANVHQKQLFRDSLHAAFTLEEVRTLLANAGLEGLKVYQSSPRHWTAISES